MIPGYGDYFSHLDDDPITLPPPAPRVPYCCCKCQSRNAFDAPANRGEFFVCGQCRADEKLWGKE